MEQDLGYGRCECLYGQEREDLFRGWYRQSGGPERIGIDIVEVISYDTPFGKGQAFTGVDQLRWLGVRGQQSDPAIGSVIDQLIAGWLIREIKYHNKLSAVVGAVAVYGQHIAACRSALMFLRDRSFRRGCVFRKVIN